MGRRKGTTFKDVQLPRVAVLDDEGNRLSAETILKRLVNEHTTPLLAQIRERDDTIRELRRVISTMQSLCAGALDSTSPKEISQLPANQPVRPARADEIILDTGPEAELADEDQYGQGRWI